VQREVRVDAVAHPVPGQERVAVLRENDRFEGDREFVFVHQGVGGVAEQAVAGVVLAHLGDVQLLLLPVQVPNPVLHPVRPRREGNAGGAGRELVVAVAFGQLHAAAAEQPQAGGQFGDDGERVAAADLVLAAAGEAAGFGRVSGGVGRHGTTVLHAGCDVLLIYLHFWLVVG
jgi:hypothetical protein